MGALSPAQRAARSAQRRCCGRFVIFAGSARAGDCRQPWGLYASTSGPRALLHSAVLVPAAPGPENTQFRHFQRINDRITSPGGPNRPARSIPTPKSVPGQHGRGSLAPEHQYVRIRHPGGATTRESGPIRPSLSGKCRRPKAISQIPRPRGAASGSSRAVGVRRCQQP